MAKFKIKKSIEDVFGVGAPKGIVFEGKTAITTDPAWVKELRKLPKAMVEEVEPAAG